jgi:hypothetical protein
MDKGRSMDLAFDTQTNANVAAYSFYSMKTKAWANFSFVLPCETGSLVLDV